jgi:hypothetical protein
MEEALFHVTNLVAIISEELDEDMKNALSQMQHHHPK